jgi:hypothetical protein
MSPFQIHDHTTNVTLDPVDPSVFDSSYDFDTSDEHLSSPLSILTHQVQRFVSALHVNPLHLLLSYLESRLYQELHRQQAEEEDEIRWREQVSATFRVRREHTRDLNGEGDPPPPYQLFAGADERILQVWDGGQMFFRFVAPPAYESLHG